MDIKLTKPSLSQEANSALNQTGGSSGSPILMSQFTIRTMADDLKNAASQPVEKLTGAAAIAPPDNAPAPYLKTVPPPAPQPAPEPKAESEKETQTRLELERKTAERLVKEAQEKAHQEKKAADRVARTELSSAKEAQEQELREFLAQTKTKFAAKEFDLAITEAQKAVASPAAGWIDKWQAKRLINKAQKEIDKKIDEPKIAPILPAAPRAVPRGVSPTGETLYGGEQSELYAAKKEAPSNLPTAEEALSLKIEPSAPPTPQIVTTAPRGGPPAGGELYAAAQKKPAPSFQNLIAPATTEEPTEVLDLKKIALVGLASLAVLILIIGGFWYFLKQPSSPQASRTPSPKPSLSASPTATPTPAALFQYDSQKIFVLPTGQEKKTFQETIAQLAQTDEPTENLIYLLFKDSSGQFPSLIKIASSTGIDLFDLPTQTSAGPLKNQLNLNRFSFFVYSQNSASSTPFTASANSGRWGLVIETKNIASTSIEDLTKSLKDLEQLMPTGLKILLPDLKNGLPANPIFLDNNYRNAAIRYLNLPKSDLTLDWTIFNDKLILATSKASMYAMIDRLIAPTQTSPSPSTP